MLRNALASWNKLPRHDRLLDREPGQLAAAGSFADLYPQDGLVLEVFSRDLSGGGDKAKGGNQDHVWFKKDEVVSMIPKERTPDARQPAPDKLPQRLARYHLVDNVNGLRGEGIQTGKADVKKAELAFVVQEVKGDLLSLKIAGSTRTEYLLGGKAERGYDASLLGRAVYDLKRQKFTTFDLVALGTRWGERPARKGSAEQGVMGFAFRITHTQDGVDRVPPSQLRRSGYFD